MMTPIVIAAAPNGARRGKADHPALPLTADEIAREAARCREAGAAMLHLHVRDADGRHSLDPDAYREAMAAVRREAGPDLLIQPTTEAVGIYGPEAQMAAMDALRPDAFSAALRELVPDAAAEPAAARFYAAHAKAGVLVQHILYDTADVARLEEMVRRGVIPDAGCSVLFVLGRYTAGQTSDPRDLLPFLAAFAGRFPWMLCAFGAREGACAATAAALGGHVRVGFENNLWLATGSLASGTAALVAQAVAALPLLGRTPADAVTARALLRPA